MRGTTAVIGLMLSAVLVAGCSSGSAPSQSPAGSDPPATPGELVSVRCTKCHSTVRIKAASKDAAAWKVTVGRMRGKGAQLSDAEAEQIIEFLAGGGAAGL